MLDDAVALPVETEPRGTMEVSSGEIAEEEKPNVFMKKKAHKKRKKLLYQTIRNQVEFYFSDANISKDRCLGKLIQDEPNISLEFLMRCNKIAALVSSIDELAKALQGSELLSVSDDKRTVRRITKIQTKTNSDECSIYVETVPPDANHEYISNIFSEYGKVVYVSLPKFHGTHTNKGFAFVEFDTPEEAAKALQVFWDKGCCLPTHMPPEKLCSVQTFESGTENLKGRAANSKMGSSHLDGEENKEGVENMKLQDNHSHEESSAHTKLEKDNVSTVESSGVVESAQLIQSLHGEDEAKMSKAPKKRKLKDIEQRRTEEELEEQSSKNIEDEGKISKVHKKRKLSEEEQACNEVELDEHSSKKIKVQEDKSVLDTDESTRAESGTTENKKRHRKKKKKTKEDKSEVFAEGLQILSKREWKRLRNKYLDMQKQKMNQVKSRLYQAQSYYHKWKNNDSGNNKPLEKKNEGKEAANARDTGRVMHSPGIIIKVTFDEAISCVPTFKSEAKSHSCVKYIDVNPGNWEAYLRCSSSSDAVALVERQPWPQMSILEGDEENSYWEKIKKDRADKINNKVVGRIKERGKKKLLRKAEKMRGTHLLFN